MARTAALLAAAVLCWSRQTFTFAATTSANQPINYNSAFIKVINDTNSYNSDDRTKSDGAVTHQNQNDANHAPGIADALTIDTSVTSSVSSSVSSKIVSPVYRANKNTNNNNSGGASIKFRDERSRFFPTYGGGEYVVDTSVSTSTSNFRSKPNRTLVDRSSLKTRNSDNRHLLLETPVFVKSTQNHPNHRQYSNINNEADSLLKAINDLNSAAIVVRTSSSTSNSQSANNHKPSDNTMQIIDDDIPIVQILNGSDVESLRRRLEMSTEYFLVPDKPTTSTIPPSTLSTIASIITRSSITPEHPNDLLLTPRTPVFRNEVWVIPVLALSAICMILIASFEVFVLCKAWRTTPSRRHLFLGQMLLLGLFACAGLGGVLAMAPTQATCAAVRFGAGVAYAVVFASLLVKCVFLISLNGGVYLPAPYQGLLLLFAVLIQVAIGAQWLLTAPPLVDVIQVEDQNIPPPRHRLLVTAEDVTSAQQILQITLCRTPYIDVLFSLCYVLFLIVFVAILAIKSRGIRDNYREATYIGLSVGCTIPIWLVWTLSGLVVGERHRDACLAFGLVITAAVIFLVMFMPKGRQLAAMGKDGVFLEDREDRFSSLSRAGSGYSPSFFHFKPIKYGTKHQPPPATITTLGAGKF